MSDGFQRVLDHIRSIAGTEAEKGRLFERLIKAYFQQDPLYCDRFAEVWLWSEWAATRPDFDGTDIGIDLVAEEREGGYCAIQSKCYAPGTRISEAHLDSFISASAREPFTARIVVDTGDEWGPNANKTIIGLKRACQVLRFGDLASRPFDWPDFADEEKSTLIVNDHIRLSGIPAEAHDYQVNGRTPLEWFIDRYRITHDKESGIVNDPNAWFDDPRDLISAFRRIVHVSVETAAIVARLPSPFSEPE